MTERIYYTHSYQQEFTAIVVAVQSVEGKPYIELDRTCFYPTSGGQAFDTGSLAGLRVSDVLVDQAGAIQHVVATTEAASTDLPQVGASVQGQINWARRYDHMQQHSGQHLLSQLLFEQWGAETVAVHFGESDSTIDIAVEELLPDQVDATERRANELIYAALPIHAYFVNDQELTTIPLRRPPKVTGTIRIVEIDKYDYSACGGTHVRTTAEIGPLKITKVERRRNQFRVTFLCGGRAYTDYAEKHRLLMEAAALFSNEIQQVPALITRNLALLKERERTLEAVQKELLHYEATALLDHATKLGAIRVIQHSSDAQNANVLKTLALELQRHDQVIALLASVEDSRVTLCYICDPKLVESRQLHMGNLLRSTLAPLQGKGGGKGDFAQGGGIHPTEIPTVFATAYQQLEELLNK